MRGDPSLQTWCREPISTQPTETPASSGRDEIAPQVGRTWATRRHAPAPEFRPVSTISDVPFSASACNSSMEKQLRRTPLDHAASKTFDNISPPHLPRLFCRFSGDGVFGVRTVYAPACYLHVVDYRTIPARADSDRSVCISGFGGSLAQSALRSEIRRGSDVILKTRYNSANASCRGTVCNVGG